MITMKPNISVTELSVNEVTFCIKRLRLMDCIFFFFFKKNLMSVPSTENILKTK